MVLRSFEGAVPSASDPGVSFRPIEIPIASWNLFDLGVVDVNGDGLMDIFTANHNALQSLLINQGDLRFRDQLTELGLSQCAAFPGLEDGEEGPVVEGPGLYVFVRTGQLVLQAKGIDESDGFAGEIKVFGAFDVVAQSGFTSVKRPWFAANGTLNTSLRFRVAGEGTLALSVVMLGAPIQVELDPAADLNLVFVGRSLVSPQARSMTLALRDRHGMAWSDVDDDGRMDVFMVRGGLKGRAPELETELFEELFVRHGEGFVDKISAYGLKKQHRRSRGVAWVDADGSGRLAAFVQCARSEDQLFARNAKGTFHDVAAEFSLNGVDTGPFMWLDVDGDMDVDLLREEGTSLVLHENVDGRFVPAGVATGGFQVGGQGLSVVMPLVRGIANFTAADFDGDGDVDIFAASRQGSRLLLNVEGRLFSEGPESFGLPVSAAAASWVDYDNDGLEDLHVVPLGLYRQAEPGRFVKTGLHRGPAVTEARCTWVDLDNDGRRDLVVATKPRGERYSWLIEAHRNVVGRNNWLQVDLVWRRGNRPAIGAVVWATVGERKILRTVGHAEGSHFSQGHYRLYFGLGRHELVDRLLVRWPDGSATELRDVAANALLTIKQE